MGVRAAADAEPPLQPGLPPAVRRLHRRVDGRGRGRAVLHDQRRRQGRGHGRREADAGVPRRARLVRHPERARRHVAERRRRRLHGRLLLAARAQGLVRAVAVRAGRPEQRRGQRAGSAADRRLRARDGQLRDAADHELPAGHGAGKPGARVLDGDASRRLGLRGARAVPHRGRVQQPVAADDLARRAVPEGRRDGRAAARRLRRDLHGDLKQPRLRGPVLPDRTPAS